jgi:hypothetical protein
MNTLPLQFLVMTLAGCVSRNQQDVIEYLWEENRILREDHGLVFPPFQCHYCSRGILDPTWRGTHRDVKRG